MHPGPPDGVQVERTVFNIELRIGPLHLDRGGQHPVVQSHDHLEERCYPGGGLRMPDLRLDRAQGDVLFPLAQRRAIDIAQPLKLSRVARRGRRAVRLDEIHVLRAVSRPLVGAANRPGLPLGVRRVDTLGAPVGRRADPTDNGIDLVPIAFCIGQAPEGHHAQAFAQYRAVGLIGEGAAVAGLREGRGLAEAHVHEGVVQRVGATRDHQVRMPEL